MSESSPNGALDEAVVTTSQLTRRFGTLTAVDRLDLTLSAGCVFGLLGPNGAGKSTLIKMLTTLLPPSAGAARVAGFDVVRQSREVRRRIGYVPQSLSADGGLTGFENLSLSGKLYGIARRERLARIDEALRFMGLTEVADKLVRNYSGGMIRRLEIAGAMLHRPGVLFLDEPTVGLDPVARRAVWERLGELRRLYGTSILMTTHDMEEADTLCERVAIMHLGRVAASGSPGDLKKSVGESATLDDVFAHYSGATIEQGGSYRATALARRTAQRLG